MGKIYKYLTCFVCALLIFGSSTSVNAQDTQDKEVYRIVTSDGNTYIGVIVFEDEVSLILKTDEIGEITIRKEIIVSRRRVEPSQMKDGVYWHENPNATRYFFGTNALPIRKGEGYYQNIWVFFNSVNVGVSDNFSMGGGFIPTFLFGTADVPLWVTPKATFPIASDNVHIGVGALIGGIIGVDNSGFSMAYGNVTLGDRDRNASLGVGLGYADGEFADTPLINISGMYRFTKNAYFITENYFVTSGGETYGILMFGARVTRESFAVDFGLFRPTEAIDMIGFPWLGVSLPFGR